MNFSKQLKQLSNTRLIIPGILLALLGASAVFAFAPYYFIPISFISFSLYFCLLRQANTAKRALLLSTFFFGGYFFNFIALADTQLIFYTIIGTSIYLTTLAIVLIGYPTWRARRLNIIWQIGLFVLLWSAVEWLRSHFFGGIPWLLTSYIWLGNETIAQAHALFGSYGLGIVTMYMVTIPAAILLKPKQLSSWIGIVIALIIFIALFVYGHARLTDAQLTYWPNIKLRMVQTDFQSLDREITNTRPLLKKILTQTFQKPDDNITAFIWPEAAINHYYVSNADKKMLRYNKFIKKIAQQLPQNSVLVTGLKRANILDKAPPSVLKHWHGMAVINSTGKIVAIHDKHHLVPIAEYMPLKSIVRVKSLLSYINGDLALDYTSGDAPNLFMINPLPSFSPLVCFESLFSGDVINPLFIRPQWILVVSNDFWYQKTRYIDWVSEMTRARAIEEGLPIIRVVNAGMSGVFDGYGRIIKLLPRSTYMNYDTKLPKPPKQITLFSQFGNYIFYFMITSLILLLLISYIFLNRR